MRFLVKSLRRFGAGWALAAWVVAPTATWAGALAEATYSFSMGGGVPLVFPADGTITGSAVSFFEITLQPGTSFGGTITTPLNSPPATGLAVIVQNHLGGTWAGDLLTGTSVRISTESIISGFGGTPLITVPYDVGEAGTFSINEGGVAISVFAQGWTSGTLTIDDGSGGTIAVATGTVMTGTPGSVTLVAGARVESSLAPPTFQIHRLHLVFEQLAPEPAGLVTLSVCGLVLVYGARRRAA